MKLKLLFKKVSKTGTKNYRPTFLIRLVSKIIETQSFLDKNDIIYRYQSGFRKIFSTNLCLSYLKNKIPAGFESGLYTGRILIELQKDFDTVNNNILSKKMEFIGFSEETTKWLKSYLSNRKF